MKNDDGKETVNAEDFDADELYALGNKYYFDAADFARAVECWEKCGAHAELFVCRRFGIGVPRDLELSETHRFMAAADWLFGALRYDFEVECMNGVAEFFDDVVQRTRELAQAAAKSGNAYAAQADDDQGWASVDFYDLLMAAGKSALELDKADIDDEYARVLSRAVERWLRRAKDRYSEGRIAEYADLVDYAPYFARMRKIVLG